MFTFTIENFCVLEGNTPPRSNPSHLPFSGDWTSMDSKHKHAGLLDSGSGSCNPKEYLHDTLNVLPTAVFYSYISFHYLSLFFTLFDFICPSTACSLKATRPLPSHKTNKTIARSGVLFLSPTHDKLVVEIPLNTRTHDQFPIWQIEYCPSPDPTKINTYQALLLKSSENCLCHEVAWKHMQIAYRIFQPC